VALMSPSSVAAHNAWKVCELYPHIARRWREGGGLESWAVKEAACRLRWDREGGDGGGGDDGGGSSSGGGYGDGGVSTNTAFSRSAGPSPQPSTQPSTQLSKHAHTAATRGQCLVVASSAQRARTVLSSEWKRRLAKGASLAVAALLQGPWSLPRGSNSSAGRNSGSHRKASSSRST